MAAIITVAQTLISEVAPQVSVVATLISGVATGEPETTIYSENKILFSTPCNRRIYEKSLDSIL